jgi:hypothetical protein
MTIFLIATAPALTWLARLSEFRSDRKQASHSPKVEINPFPWSGLSLAYNRAELESFKARNGGDISKLTGRHRWPGQL